MVYWGDIDCLEVVTFVGEEEDWVVNNHNRPCSVVVVVVELVDGVVRIEDRSAIHFSAFVEVVVDLVVREEDDQVVD
jgi:hypothetical protein